MLIRAVSEPELSERKNVKEESLVVVLENPEETRRWWEKEYLLEVAEDEGWFPDKISIFQSNKEKESL